MTSIRRGSSPLARGLRPDDVRPVGRIPDHPRSRGVYTEWGQGSRVPLGSSPLARGLPQCCRKTGARPRIIPARAGFTRSRAWRHRESSDHPRSRGVYLAGVPVEQVADGSSPLARGLQLVTARELPLVRIIPARAGFTICIRVLRAVARDHPRSRGVYPRVYICACQMRGSSPLARGLLCRCGRLLLNRRIIPARAGFTRHAQVGQLRAQDHPRSRGVYLAESAGARVAEGSSPLARGLLRAGERVVDLARIIPARAGFTVTVNEDILRRADHPRSRGVYKRSSGRSGRRGGSSPLARGLLSMPSHKLKKGRIIPARAGFTAPGIGPARPSRDHPRSRGVYSSRKARRRIGSGSSPLARGLRFRLAFVQALTRIIPARAGFTGITSGRILSRLDHPRSRGVYAEMIS